MADLYPAFVLSRDIADNKLSTTANDSFAFSLAWGLALLRHGAGNQVDIYAALDHCVDRAADHAGNFAVYQAVHADAAAGHVVKARDQLAHGGSALQATVILMRLVCSASTLTYTLMVTLSIRSLAFAPLYS